MAANKERNLEYIKEFEQEHNVTVIPYGLLSLVCWWGAAGPRNASVNIWLKWWRKHFTIRIGKEVVEKLPLNILKLILWHELGHIRCRQFFSTETFADGYALNHSGLSIEEFIQAKAQMEAFFRFGIFDLEELRKLEHLSTWKLVKIDFGMLRLDRINLDGTKKDTASYRKLLNKRDPLDRLILEESEAENLSVSPIGVKGNDKKEKKSVN